MAKILTSFVAVESRSLRRALGGYMAQALTMVAVIACFATYHAPLALWAATAFVTKFALISWMLRHEARAGEDREVEPWVGPWASAALIGVLALAGYSFVHCQAAAFAPTPLAMQEPYRTNLAVALTLLVVGIYAVLTRRDIGLGFLVAMLTCYPFDSYCQLETLSANSDDKSLASMIRYANPLEYDIEYIFELYPDFNKIDRGKDLKLWIAAPREWDSQKNVRFVSILPSPDSIYIDKEFGNKLVFWDFGRYLVESFYRVRIRVRFESYEISSWISADLVGPYDKTNKEYALYTRSTHTINITPKVNEFAREAIGDEVNPYLQERCHCQRWAVFVARGGHCCQH